MNLTRVEQIAKAVLYEGYLLYPYRPSSVKNQQRWNFGVVYPQSYSEAQDGHEASSMRTECLVRGNGETKLEVRLRFLHLRTRSLRGDSQNPAAPVSGWQEAVERDVSVPEVTLGNLSSKTARNTVRQHEFEFPPEMEADMEHIWQQAAMNGVIDVAAENVGEDLFRVRVEVRNTSKMRDRAAGRDVALMQSLISTHTILGVAGGEFVSLLEPPAELQTMAAECKNKGAWPVLVGDAGERDTLLASPIILYDYPQIAPESVGDLFDGTEIDEILSLRIMTLTDEEKSEIRNSDDRARQILERTESMPAEQFMKLHGVVRGMRPVEEAAEALSPERKGDAA